MVELAAVFLPSIGLELIESLVPVDLLVVEWTVRNHKTTQRLKPTQSIRYMTLLQNTVVLGVFLSFNFLFLDIRTGYQPLVEEIFFG